MSLTIYASQSIDDLTFRRLYAITAGYQVRLRRKPVKDVFGLPKKNQKSLKALTTLDAIWSVYKGLTKLDENQTV